MPYQKQNFKDDQTLSAYQLELIEDGILELEKYYSLLNLVAMTEAEILEICKTKGK